MDNILKLAGIVPESSTDGPGLRFTVFCQGCVHHCTGCHNPETWDFAGGDNFLVTDIFEKISANILLSGVTFSGGEPFCQAAAFLKLAKLCKQKNLEIAIYTGYTFEYILQNGTPDQKALLSEIDVLVDGKFVLAEKSLALKFCGSKNQRILDVPKSLFSGTATLKNDGRWSDKTDNFPPVQINYGL